MKVRGINFSYTYTKGSVESRNKTTERICADIYSNLMKNFLSNRIVNRYRSEQTNINFHKIEQLVKDNLPEYISFYIARKKVSDNYDGCIKIIHDRNRIKTYRMELPLVDKKLNREKIPTFMHELRHLIDIAIDPQYRVLEQKLCESGKREDILKFYKEFYYPGKKVSDYNLKKNTLKFLKDYDTEHAILVLKYIKKLLVTENNAFGTAKMYGKKVAMMFCLLARYDYGEYRFKDKIALVDELRKDLIQKERSKNARQIKLDEIRKNIISVFK